MKIKISKWGNSMALRIPTAFVKEIKLKDGDSVEITLSKDGSLIIRPQKLSRKEIMEKLRAFRATLKMGTSVMDEVCSGARY